MRFFIAFFIALSGPLYAQTDEAQQWEEAIAVVAKMSEDYARRADAAGEYEYLGTMMNEVDVPRHTCSILGRMLGKTELIAHLEEPYPQNSDGDSTFRVASQSLDNWVYTARRLIGVSVPIRVEEWNNGCAGKLQIPATARIAVPVGQVVFSVSGADISVMGEVGPGYAQQLERALDQNSAVTRVGLSGGGQDLAEAIQAARLIRQRGLDTTVVSGCTGACALVFMGGVNRTIWSPYPDLAMSPAEVQGRVQPPGSQAYRIIEQFVNEMGADGRVFVQLMQNGPVSGFMNGRTDELCNARVVTWIQRACSAP